MFDAFVSCWNCKYTYWTARPSMRISDPSFTTVITTPNFPSYTSGHYTVSAAAAVVMGALFPDKAGSFQAQAAEAAISRLWGGIQFSHDDGQGLLVGHQITASESTSPRTKGTERAGAGAGGGTIGAIA